uniref:L-seryl-tRNA(Sec) kinase n=1 Tax=Anopheles farauti TaxID=69004 RepID=A0A182QQR0_9DIPT
MARICVNVLVGIPASGKTSYCQKLIALPCRQFEVVHICYDLYIKIDQQYDTFRDEVGLYKTRRQMLLSFVDAIIAALKENDHAKLNTMSSNWKEAFDHGIEISPRTDPKDIVFLIDDNNYYRSMRWEWMKLARKHSLGYFETYFDTPLQIALKRNQKRSSPIHMDVIERMWTRLEKPCGKLFTYEQHFIAVEEHMNIDTIVAKILHSFQYPLDVPTPLEVSAPMEQSKIHRVDIILRKTVSKRIATVKDSMSKAELQTHVNMLQERKRCILEQIRLGGKDFPEEMMQVLVEELF